MFKKLFNKQRQFLPKRSIKQYSKEYKSADESSKPIYRNELGWKDKKFYDEKNLDQELRRVFEVCHGCRRCFNLCNSFPKLFQMVDESDSGEIDSVNSSEFKKVADECTMCDMCFNNKCPYVPPHPFNIDFPHLMLRYKALENKKKNEVFVEEESSGIIDKITGYTDESVATPVHIEKTTKTELTLQKPSFFEEQITKTDRNGKLATILPFLSNYLISNRLVRKVLSTFGIHEEAHIPTYSKPNSNDKIIKNEPRKLENRKVLLYSTCLGNYNSPDILSSSKKILEIQGCEVIVDYSMCCGMPQLEQGDLASVSKSAKEISTFLKKYIDQGFTILTFVPSCSLMFKNEWPLILPKDENVKLLSKHTKDICEYICDIAKKEGLAEGLSKISYPITLHHSCHARALNVGNKANELLKHIPEVKIEVIERCSGHGGSWGVKHFETALKVGKAVSRNLSEKDTSNILSSECPLAASHVTQGASILVNKEKQWVSKHPVEIFAEAYGIGK
eukprot:gene2541-3503_t